MNNPNPHASAILLMSTETSEAITGICFAAAIVIVVYLMSREKEDKSTVKPKKQPNAQDWNDWPLDEPKGGESYARCLNCGHIQVCEIDLMCACCAGCLFEDIDKPLEI